MPSAVDTVPLFWTGGRRPHPETSAVAPKEAVRKRRLILGVVMKNRIVLARSIECANVQQPAKTGVPACEGCRGRELFLRHPEFLRIAALGRCAAGVRYCRD